MECFRKERHRKLYLVTYSEGIGVMESPSIDKGIVADFDEYADAKKKAEELFLLYNSKEQIDSGWTSHHFKVCINTNLKQGKLLYKIWSEEFDKRWKSRENDPNYTKFVLPNGVQVLMENPPDIQPLNPIAVNKDNARFFTPDSPSTSFRFEVFDLSSHELKGNGTKEEDD